MNLYTLHCFLISSVNYLLLSGDNHDVLHHDDLRDDTHDDPHGDIHDALLRGVHSPHDGRRDGRTHDGHGGVRGGRDDRDDRDDIRGKYPFSIF